MAWPQALGLPPTPAEVFFVAAALWFAITAVLATRMIATRLVRGYHALKMLAMAWMWASGARSASDLGMAGNFPLLKPGMA